MAKSKFDIDTIRQFEVSDFEKLSDSDLKEVVGVLRDVTTKRYKRGKEKNEISPAMKGLEKSGGLLTASNKELLKRSSESDHPTTDVRKLLIKEAIRGQRFDMAKTSRSAGFTQVVKSIAERIGVKYGEKGLNKQNYQQMWDIIHKIDELSKNNQELLDKWKGFGSDLQQRLIALLVKNKPKASMDDILSNVTQRLDELNEESKKQKASALSQIQFKAFE